MFRSKTFYSCGVNGEKRRENNIIQRFINDEFYGLFYQSSRMNCIYKTYSKVTFIDGTYVINEENFACINFVVTDHNRESRVVGFVTTLNEKVFHQKCACQCVECFSKKMAM